MHKKWANLSLSIIAFFLLTPYVDGSFSSDAQDMCCIQLREPVIATPANHLLAIGDNQNHVLRTAHRSTTSKLLKYIQFFFFFFLRALWHSVFLPSEGYGYDFGCSLWQTSAIILHPSAIFATNRTVVNIHVCDL